MVNKRNVMPQSVVLLFIIIQFILLSTQSPADAEDWVICNGCGDYQPNSALPNQHMVKEFSAYETALNSQYTQGGDTFIVTRGPNDPLYYDTSDSKWKLAFYYLPTNSRNINDDDPESQTDDTINYQGDLGFVSSNGTKKGIILKKDETETAECLIRSNTQDHPTINITSDNPVGVTIEGFTIIGARGAVIGGGLGGAMHIEKSANVNNCVIRDSSARFGGAVYVSQAMTKPIFKNCIFHNNAARVGGAVYVDTGDPPPMPLFFNCLFTGNMATYSDGDVFYVKAASGSIVNCTLVNNNSSNGVIYQTGSNVPMTIMNSIIVANDDNHLAIRSESSPHVSAGGIAIFGASISDCYVRGKLEGYLEGGVVNIYMPTQVMLYDEDAYYEPGALFPSGDNPDPEYIDYDVENPPLYVVPSANGNIFNLTFAPYIQAVDGPINLYRLANDSSCIGLGSTYLKTDFDDELRPYYLSGRSDLGWDEYTFCAYHDWETINGNNIPYDSEFITVGKWFQDHKTTLFEITPSESGILHISSDTSEVDLLGILSFDCEGTEQIISDGKNGTWKNFHINYVQAQAGVPYYLAVVNQSDNPGKYKLHVSIESDGEANSCAVADAQINSGEASPFIFTEEYFAGEDGNAQLIGDSVTAMTIDSVEDEDVYRLDFSPEGYASGTLVITCEFVKIPVAGQNEPVMVDAPAKYLDIELKDANCNTVAIPAGKGDLTIIDHNPDNSSRYLTVKRNAALDESVLPLYSFKACYFSPDEDLDNKTGRLINFGSQMSGAITYPGDMDYFHFIVPEGEGGTIRVWTSDCTAGVLSQIKVYNSLWENFQDNGENNGSNYEISSVKASGFEDGVPFFVSSGTYYLRVAHTASPPDPRTYDYTAPFSYKIQINFISNSDDYADYHQLAAVVFPWNHVNSSRYGSDPELYYETKAGRINSSGDKDFFRIEVPYKAVLDVMVESASLPVLGTLYDFKGVQLETVADIRTTNAACLNDAPDAGRISREVEKGVYYIGISSASILTYELAVDIDDFPDTYSYSYIKKSNWAYNKTAGHIEAASASACTGGPDVDAFRLDVKHDNQFRIYTTGDLNTSGQFYQCTNYDSENDVCLQWQQLTTVIVVDEDGNEIPTPLSDFYIKDYDLEKDINQVEPDRYGNFFLGAVGVNKDPRSKDYEHGAFGVPLAVGVYSVLVSTDPETQGSPTGDYEIHFMQEDDYCNTSSCIDPPEVGVLTGVASLRRCVISYPGDIDYFSYTIDYQRQVVYDEHGVVIDPDMTRRLYVDIVNVQHPGEKPPFNLLIKLMDSDNKRLIYSSSGSLEFDVVYGEQYYLSFNPEFAMNTGEYAFSFRLVNLEADDDGADGSTGNDFTQARFLAESSVTGVWADYEGQIDREGDYDYYYFEVEGDGELSVYTTGDTDTYGYLFLMSDGMYNLEKSDDDSGDGRNFQFYYYKNSIEKQTFYVKVRGYSPKETGAYLLHVSIKRGIADDHGDECETATFVSLSSDTNKDDNELNYEGSRIGIPGDNDYFKIVAGPVWSPLDKIGESLSEPMKLNVYTSYSGGDTLDTFGYLKDLVCGTIALNDNGSGGSDGENFRINYDPDCGSDCIPQTYHVLVKSFNGSETGQYNFHVESNGAFVSPISTTRINMPANTTEYVGFETPTHLSYLHASKAKEDIPGSDLHMEDVKVTLMEGDGTIVSKADNLGQDVIIPIEQRSLPIYIDGLKRGIHYLKIDNFNTDHGGPFTLKLSCSPIGSFGYNGAVGWFRITDNVFDINGNGLGFTGTTDMGYFVYRKFDSGFETIAKVKFTEGTGQAGLMVRNDIEDPSDKNAFIFVRYSNGVYRVFGQYRSNVGGSTLSVMEEDGETIFTSGPLATPCYLRMHYGGSGSEILMSYSENGKDWLEWSTESGAPSFTDPSRSADVSLVTPLFVGFAVSPESVNAQVSCRVEISDIQVVQIPTGEN